ncbi:MAG: acyl-ACP thioesterase domain-containing protein [Bacteroidales bacterium]
MEIYSEEGVVKNWESAPNGLYKPFAFLNKAQELANLHANCLGFGYGNLIASNFIWVLSRFYIQFIRVPKWQERLCFETWHKGSNRLFGLRDFRVTDSKGETVINATSSWLIIDHKSRKIQNIESALKDYHRSGLKRDAVVLPAPKLRAPANLKFNSIHRVSYSDIDINGHTNNAKYFEWGADALPFDIMKEFQIKELILNYNNESFPMEEIELFTSLEPTLFVEGRRGNDSIFQMEIR